MVKNKNNTYTLLLAIICIAFLFSSCNRGYGCPGEFSLAEYILNLF